MVGEGTDLGDRIYGGLGDDVLTGNGALHYSQDSKRWSEQTDILQGNAGSDIYQILQKKGAVHIYNHASKESQSADDQTSALDYKQDYIVLSTSLSQLKLHRDGYDLQLAVDMMVVDERSEGAVADSLAGNALPLVSYTRPVEIKDYFKHESERHISLVDPDGWMWELEYENDKLNIRKYLTLKNPLSEYTFTSINQGNDLLISALSSDKSDQNVEEHITTVSDFFTVQDDVTSTFYLWETQSSSSVWTFAYNQEKDVIEFSWIGTQDAEAQVAPDLYQANLFGGGGDDHLKAGLAGSLLLGGAGDYTLIDAAGDDVLFGDDDNDLLLVSSSGQDFLVGGKGTDVIRILESARGVKLISRNIDEDSEDIIEVAFDPFQAVFYREDQHLIIASGVITDSDNDGINDNSAVIVLNNYFLNENNRRYRLAKIGETNRALDQQALASLANVAPNWQHYNVEIPGKESDDSSILYGYLPALGEQNDAALENDVLVADAQHSEVYGLHGDDTLSGSGLLVGGSGSDKVYGSDKSDLLIAGVYQPDDNNYQDPRFESQGDKNYLYGFGGDDQLYSSVGTDILDGGVGDDFYSFSVDGSHDEIIDIAGSDDRLYIHSADKDKTFKPQDIWFKRQGHDLLVLVRNGFGDISSVTIRNFYKVGYGHESRNHDFGYDSGVLWHLIVGQDLIGTIQQHANGYVDEDVYRFSIESAGHYDISLLDRYGQADPDVSSAYGMATILGVYDYNGRLISSHHSSELINLELESGEYTIRISSLNEYRGSYKLSLNPHQDEPRETDEIEKASHNMAQSKSTSEIERIFLDEDTWIPSDTVKGLAARMEGSADFDWHADDYLAKARDLGWQGNTIEDAELWWLEAAATNGLAGDNHLAVIGRSMNAITGYDTLDFGDANGPVRLFSNRALSSLPFQVNTWDIAYLASGETQTKQIYLEKGQVINIYMEGRWNAQRGSLSDPKIYGVYYSAGSNSHKIGGLAAEGSAGNMAGGHDSFVTFTAPSSGLYYVRVGEDSSAAEAESDSDSGGTYRLTVTDTSLPREQAYSRTAWREEDFSSYYRGFERLLLTNYNDMVRPTWAANAIDGRGGFDQLNYGRTLSGINIVRGGESDPLTNGQGIDIDFTDEKRGILEVGHYLTGYGSSGDGLDNDVFLLDLKKGQTVYLVLESFEAIEGWELKEVTAPDGSVVTISHKLRTDGLIEWTITATSQGAYLVTISESASVDAKNNFYKFYSLASADEPLTRATLSDVRYGDSSNAEGDSLKNIEYIIGTNHDDYIEGSSANDWLNGRRGHDVLKGNEGNDVFIIDQAFEEKEVDGGSDFDLLDLSSLRTGVNINQAAGHQKNYNVVTANQGKALALVTNIEYFKLSRSDDVFHKAANDISGKRIDGQGGSNTISYEESMDSISIQRGESLESERLLDFDHARMGYLGLGQYVEGYGHGEFDRDSYQIADRLIAGQQVSLLLWWDGDDMPWDFDAILDSEGKRIAFTKEPFSETVTGQGQQQRISFTATKDGMYSVRVGEAGAYYSNSRYRLARLEYETQALTDLKLADIRYGSGGNSEGDILENINRIQGSAYNDWIEGHNGIDEITGNAGNDWLMGGDGDDSYLFSANHGHDDVDDHSGIQSLIFDENFDHTKLTVSSDIDDNMVLSFYGDDQKSVTLHRDAQGKINLDAWRLEVNSYVVANDMMSEFVTLSSSFASPDKESYTENEKQQLAQFWQSQA